jgi:hypothetical protein
MTTNHKTAHHEVYRTLSKNQYTSTCRISTIELVSSTSGSSENSKIRNV